MLQASYSSIQMASGMKLWLSSGCILDGRILTVLILGACLWASTEFTGIENKLQMV